MLTIRLLGPPAIERDGVPVRSPRGRKAWALLAYLLLAERPPGRRHLAELFFADADDPLGALRWTLSELRRSLGRPEALQGDPVQAGLGDPVVVDVRQVLDRPPPRPLLPLSGELLEGVQLPTCLAFESWLLVMRHRVAAAVEAAAHQAAVALLAAGRAGEAIPYAARAVAVNPLEEANHEVLVRCLAVSGDRAAAVRQVAVCADLMQAELGVEPSPALREAADVGPGSAMVLATGGRAAALSQLEAGGAAITAGAVDAGLQCLRRAVTESARCRDDALRGRALLALGSALVHAVRGRDAEGVVLLQEAVTLAGPAGDRETALGGYRELGFVEVQAGRSSAAEAWLAQAQVLAETAGERAAVLGVRGMNASDRGDYPAALALLAESVDLAGSAPAARQQAWSLSILGRAHLLRDERRQAAVAVDRALELAHEQRWMAFLPWPQTLRAELDLRAGDVAGAAHGLERAWVLACQVGDPCWEGFAARGLGLLHADRGDLAGASNWLGEAVTRSNRVPDRYQWLHAHVLDAAAGAALDRGDGQRARRLVTALAPLAARADLRELVVRAHLHLARLGERAALDSARLLAADIDNPALARLLA